MLMLFVHVFGVISVKKTDIWTVYSKYLEMTFVVIWHYTNKTELDWTEFNIPGTLIVALFNHSGEFQILRSEEIYFCSLHRDFTRSTKASPHPKKQ